MKKTLKFIISVVLVVSICIATGTVSFAGDNAIDSVEVSTFSQASTELEEDEVYPTIIIHGIGQADTFMLDDNGDYVYDDDGEPVTGWPITFDVTAMVTTLILPLLISIGCQRDLGFTDAAYTAVYNAVEHLGYNDDGTPKYNYEVDGYDGRSLAECTQEEKNNIYENVPLNDYTAKVGEENLYYFSYNSLGGIYDTIDNLEALIDKVKNDTGKDKVNLIPISLGGAIAVAYVGEHPQGEDIHKIVFIAPAADGSEIIGKLMLGEVDTSDVGLYQDMFSKLCGTDEYTGWMINVAIRIMPKSMLKDFLTQIVKAFTDSALARIPTMWGLVPSSMYDRLAEMYLQDDTVLNAQIRKFHSSQVVFLDNLKTYADNGVKIYDINGYGLELYSLVASDCNSDKIIHSSSTSLGATFSKVNETLGDDYQQKYYTDYNLISPDNQVDASTCAFPFTTWFFTNQDHENLGDNDVVISLATEILIAKDMNIYSDENYPQFNYGRDTSDLKGYLNQAKRVDKTNLSAEQVLSLETAIANAEKVLATTIVVDGECENATAQLEDALVTVGVREKEDTIKDDLLLFVFKNASKLLYTFFGPRGFSDPYNA